MLIESIKYIPIQEIIGHFTELHKKGMYYYALCPFHNDKKMGSFVVNSNMNLWRCFTCDEGGDAIDFVSKICDIPTYEAAKKIAEMSNLPIENNSTLKHFPAQKKEKPKEPASSHVLNIIYQSFLSVCELTPEDKGQLEKRGLSEKEMAEFKSLPLGDDQKTVVKKLKRKLRENRIDVSFLGKVPGFFKDISTSEWKFSNYRSGILIPVRNYKQEIIRLQVRSNEEDAEQRYFWFSSSFAKGKRFRFGTSSGSVIDHIKPKEKKFPVIAVTEGKFKGIELSKLNLTTLSMQGVSTWRNIASEVEEIMNSDPFYENPTIWLFYDADVQHNKPVKKSAIKLKETLNKMGLDVEFLIWDEKYGKGIDDVILNGNRDKVKKVKTI